MELRNRIIKETEILFMRYGIRSITMDYIAEQLGISKRTIYEKFKDKNELLQTCLEVSINEQNSKRDKIVSESENVIYAIFNFMNEGIHVMNTINPVFLSDLRKYYTDIWIITFKQSKIKNYNLTFKLLRKGVNEGVFRKEINIEIVAKIILEQCKSASRGINYDLIMCFIDLDKLKHDYPNSWAKEKDKLKQNFSQFKIIWQKENLEDEFIKVIGKQCRNKHRLNKIARQEINKFINSNYWKKILNTIKNKEEELEK